MDPQLRPGRTYAGMDRQDSYDDNSWRGAGLKGRTYVLVYGEGESYEDCGAREPFSPVLQTGWEALILAPKSVLSAQANSTGFLIALTRRTHVIPFGIYRN